MMKPKYFYTGFDQDFVEARDPDYQLSENYPWIFDQPHQKLITRLLLPVFRCWTLIDLKGIHHIKIINPQILDTAKQGILYLNHTQPTLDPFLPALLLKRKRPFCSICAPSNLSIPVLGKLLPYLGAIPTASSLSEAKKMKEALGKAMEEKKWLVIYPEGHVWPWCTFIRPFDDTSTQFVLDYHIPAYTAVVCYEKAKTKTIWNCNGEKPDISVYLDGPFYPDETLPRRKARKKLHDEIYDSMKHLALNNTYQKVIYVFKNPEDETAG